jgi:hypothetical protein
MLYNVSDHQLCDLSALSKLKASRIPFLEGNSLPFTASRIPFLEGNSVPFTATMWIFHKKLILYIVVNDSATHLFHEYAILRRKARLSNAARIILAAMHAI